MTWQAEFDLANGAALAAGGLLQSSFARDAGVRYRTGKDIKTRADVEAERAILDLLTPTGLPIVAEESAATATNLGGPHWLVDPLDGTLNFTRGFPLHAVSIALWDGPTPVFGVILNSATGTMYRGMAGGGAWRDDAPITVSTVRDRSRAVLATGFPAGRDYDENALRSFVGRIQAFQKIRMIGSAAIALALVADGTFDAYFEEGGRIWDVAAGLAIVAAAGGCVAWESIHPAPALRVTATNGLVEA
jgi:myo-inositol-1(or 4)-monophosphatase